MHKRWALKHGFTVVELVIMVAVIAILAVVSIVAFNGIRQSTMAKVAQSDLGIVATEMQRGYQKHGEYPASIPADVHASDGITLVLKNAGAYPFYTNVSTVQNGTLLSQICDQLISEGKGNGVNQAGQARAYITGCGNWNHDSMQVTGWNSKVWNTPVSAQQLTNYGVNFTAGSTWDADQERVVEEFYTGLVDRLLQQGGSFPVESFWDSWATQNNGGVIQQPLETNPIMKPFYCVESHVIGHDTMIWHVTQSAKIQPGRC